jgi:hypothetical protein
MRRRQHARDGRRIGRDRRVVDDGLRHVPVRQVRVGVAQAVEEQREHARQRVRAAERLRGLQNLRVSRQLVIESHHCRVTASMRRAA